MRNWSSETKEKQNGRSSLTIFRRVSLVIVEARVMVKKKYCWKKIHILSQITRDTHRGMCIISEMTLSCTEPKPAALTSYQERSVSTVSLQEKAHLHLMTFLTLWESLLLSEALERKRRERESPGRATAGSEWATVGSWGPRRAACGLLISHLMRPLARVEEDFHSLMNVFFQWADLVWLWQPPVVSCLACRN